MVLSRIDIFANPPMLNIKFGSGPVRAGAGAEAVAASRCGYISTKMLRLLAAPDPLHW
jgi:hypothetical protein